MRFFLFQEKPVPGIPRTTEILRPAKARPRNFSEPVPRKISASLLEWQLFVAVSEIGEAFAFFDYLAQSRHFESL